MPASVRDSGSTVLDATQRFDVETLSWDKGMLLANNMRLDELLGELQPLPAGRVALPSGYHGIADFRGVFPA